MLIEKAKADDAEGIAKVHVNSWRITYKGIMPDDFLTNLSVEKSLEGLKKKLKELQVNDCNQVCFVAKNPAEEITGFVYGGQARSDYSEYKGEIHAIYVKKEEQRNKIGLKLTIEIVKWLIEKEFHGMIIWVLEKNPCRKFYEKIGGKLLPYIKEGTFGGRTLREVAYGWKDLPEFLDNI